MELTIAIIVKYIYSSLIYYMELTLPWKIVHFTEFIQLHIFIQTTYHISETFKT